MLIQEELNSWRCRQVASVPYDLLSAMMTLEEGQATQRQLARMRIDTRFV